MRGVRIVNSLVFQPLFHEMSGEKPLSRHLGGWEPLVGNKSIDDLFINIQKMGNFPGV